MGDGGWLLLSSVIRKQRQPRLGGALSHPPAHLPARPPSHLLPATSPT